MIKVSLCYSRKEGSEFASCTVDGVEFDAIILDDPIAFRDRVRVAYERAVDAVDTQLGVTIPAVNPAVSRASAPPAAPARPATPPPGPAPVPSHANGSTADDRPPTSARSLGGWSKKHNLTKWFSDLGRANNRSGMISEWDDSFAVWAYQHWLSQQPAPAATTETDHEAHLRRQSEQKAETARASTAFARNGRH